MPPEPARPLPGAGGGDGGTTRTALAIAALCVAVLLAGPLLLVDVPPLLDYPNHLARIFLLAKGAADPLLAPIFQPHWAIIPNLAIDIVGPPLARVLPIHVAGRLMLATLLLLPVVGAVAYHRAVFGVRSLWPFAAALVACNGAFLLLGFLNFVAGAGASPCWWRHLLDPRARRPAPA